MQAHDWGLISASNSAYPFFGLNAGLDGQLQRMLWTSPACFVAPPSLIADEDHRFISPIKLLPNDSKATFKIPASFILVKGEVIILNGFGIGTTYWNWAYLSLCHITVMYIINRSFAACVHICTSACISAYLGCVKVILAISLYLILNVFPIRFEPHDYCKLQFIRSKTYLLYYKGFQCG